MDTERLDLLLWLLKGADKIYFIERSTVRYVHPSGTIEIASDGRIVRASRVFNTWRGGHFRQEELDYLQARGLFFVRPPWPGAPNYIPPRMPPRSEIADEPMSWGRDSNDHRLDALRFAMEYRLSQSNRPVVRERFLARKHPRRPYIPLHGELTKEERESYCFWECWPSVIHARNKNPHFGKGVVPCLECGMATLGRNHEPFIDAWFTAEAALHMFNFALMAEYSVAELLARNIPRPPDSRYPSPLLPGPDPNLTISRTPRHGNGRRFTVDLRRTTQSGLFVTEILPATDECWAAPAPDPNT